MKKGIKKSNVVAAMQAVNRMRLLQKDDGLLHTNSTFSTKTMRAVKGGANFEHDQGHQSVTHRNSKNLKECNSFEFDQQDLEATHPFVSTTNGKNSPNHSRPCSPQRVTSKTISTQNLSQQQTSPFIGIFFFESVSK